MILNKEITVDCDQIKRIFEKLWKHYQIVAKDQITGFINILTKLKKEI